MSQSKRASTVEIRSPLDSVALAVATALGVGFIPFAPGTFGSIVGVAICYALIEALKFEPQLLLNAILATTLFLSIVGTWASSRAERILQKKDASQIVIDEVVGQLIAFAFLAPALSWIGGNWRAALAFGFVLFRLFDIFKPWPIRRLEGLGSGVGVMADDVLAGIYAAVVLSWLLLIRF